MLNFMDLARSGDQVRRFGSASVHLQDRSGTIDIHLLALPCSSDTLYILLGLEGARNSRMEPD